MNLDNLSHLMSKVISPEWAETTFARLRGPVVFTNGVFDILHRGHVIYLARARALGHSLVVALNTDDSVKRLGKGADRPLNSQEDRAIVMAGLAAVDIVTFFDENTPCDLLKRLKPQIYVKGGDYDIEHLEETRLVRSWGGEAHALPFEVGFSTTSLLARIRGR